MASDSSSDSIQGPPSFFKVVRYPSAPHLTLPIAFVRTHLGKIPKYPILKTVTGEHSWRLKIKKIGEDYCFARGWDKLAKDTQLCIRDILVFWLIDSNTFEVSFYDAHGIVKDLPLNNTSWVSGDGDGDYDDDVMPDENLCFQKVISLKTHKYTMVLPKKFVEAAGLENEKSIRMKNDKGKEWRIGLIAERYERTKYSLSVGWSVFRKYHELSDGDICLFNFIKKEGVMILAQVLRSNTSRTGIPMVEEGLNRKSVKVEVEDESCPPLGVQVKIEDESIPEAEVVKRQRGKPPLEKNCGGGVKVKIEDEVCTEEVAVKRQRGIPPLEKPAGGGGGGVEEKTEAETVVEMDVEAVKSKRGRPSLQKPEAEIERMVISKHVVYF